MHADEVDLTDGVGEIRRRNRSRRAPEDERGGVGLAEEFEVLLAIVRLGDADRLGWWRSHSVDETAEYVLRHALPNTWMATGLELAMESARIRHEAALERPTAVHLFSDYLPFHRVLRSWLIERKLEKDFQPIAWLSRASVEDLKAKLGRAQDGERRANGLFLGEVPRADLLDPDRSHDLLLRLAGGYGGLNGEFIAPYVDVVE